MDPHPQPQVNRRRRRVLWCVRLVVWPLALIWFAHYAHVRWTTPPAAVLRGAPGATSDVAGRVDALRQALRVLPTYRPSARSQSAAQTRPSPTPYALYAANLAASICGPWDPVNRPTVADVAQYLAKAGIDRALDDIVAQTEVWRESVAAEPSARRALEAALDPSDFDSERATLALLARARQRQTEKNDLSGALRDLCAAAFLQQEPPSLNRFGWYWGNMGDLGVILLHFIYIAQEADIPPAAVAETSASLMGGMPLSLSAHLERTILAQDELQALLDQHFTDDGHGNGWLVLSTLEMETAFGARPLRWPQPSGFWNLFAPLFNDRRCALEKLTRLSERIRGLDGLNYAGVRQRIETWAQSAEPMSVLEPLTMASQGRAGQFTVTAVFRDLVWRRATVVVLALSAYKHDHGEYPENLGDIAPQYIAEVPLDLLTNQPFAYERTSAGEFVLEAAEKIPSELYPYRRFYTTQGAAVDLLKRYSLHRPEADD